MPALHSSNLTGGSDLSGQLAEGFTRVSVHLRRNSARHLAPLGLTYAQARLLRTIAAASRPLRMSELAAGLGIVPRSATTTVEALETAGFVVRLPDPDDRRSVLVALTPAARPRGHAHPVRPLRRGRRSVRRPRRVGAGHPARVPRSGRRAPHGGDATMMRGGNMGMGRAAWRRDDSVTTQTLTPGILKRVLKLALGYKRMLALFLFLVTIDAVLGTLNPLILRDIINNGIGGQTPSSSSSSRCSSPGIATLDMLLTLVQRYVSARIGEALIFDMRGEGLRARAADADLVLHPHADRCARQPAQQRRDRRPAGVHRHAGSVVGNVISVTIVMVAMLASCRGRSPSRRSRSCRSSCSRPASWARSCRRSPASATW